MLALALAGPGCISPMTHLDEKTRKMPPVQAAAPPPPQPIVTLDEVTPANAAEKARALQQELDFAANERSAALPGAAPENTTKP